MVAPRSKTKKSKSPDAASKRLGELSEQFERDIIDVPILSIFEKEESVVKKRFGGTARILVSRTRKHNRSTKQN